MYIRQPIVSVMGHVDHGKTTLLDHIRRTDVAKREAGMITQHIGATEVPLETVREMCRGIMRTKRVSIPGLLFIDTPGHEAFTTLRKRGGMLADLAVLVIDVREGVKPQSVESINMIRSGRTPFVVCANKIDLLDGWRDASDTPFTLSKRSQRESVIRTLDEHIYRIAGRLVEMGFPGADRYDRISDFTRSVAIVPVSAKTGEGIADLLLTLIGLAQRYLEKRLECEDAPGEGTVLEITEERGLGRVFDVILYDGVLSLGDTVVMGTDGEPRTSKVRAILRPRPLDEIRDPRERFTRVKRVNAACGVMVSVKDPTGVIAGGLIKVAGTDVERAMDEVRRGSALELQMEGEGIVLVCDTIGSCEAVHHECRGASIRVRSARIGDVSRRDIVEAASNREPENRVVLAFNVRVSEDARQEARRSDTAIIEEKVIYSLMKAYDEWLSEMRRTKDDELRQKVSFPAKLRVLPGCVFRISKPAVVGVRVLGGSIAPGRVLMRQDGRRVGTIRSIQRKNESIPSAAQGDEVAISIQGATVGRSFREDSILYVEMSPEEFRQLGRLNLTHDETEILEEVTRIKRVSDRFWGM